MKEFLCETQELAIGYGKTPLASGIALGANPGQILVLVGPNGAGKSTLLKTLAGQLAPLGGTVLLDGQDLTAYTGTPADAALMMQLGLDGVFVGSGIFKSTDPAKRAKAIVAAVTHYNDYKILAEVSRDLGEAMPGLEISTIAPEQRMQERGW